MKYSIDENRVFPARKVQLPLIHTLKNYDVLKSIIREGFRPSYCSEYISNKKIEKIAAFPMISLSNITVKDAIIYQKSYGTFAIALKKEWGERKKFNPVLYLEQNSDLTTDIINSFEYIKVNSKKELFSALDGDRINHKNILTKNIIKLFAHSKNFDGKLIRSKKLIDEKYPFGLEREWRLIIDENDIPYFLSGEEIERKRDFDEHLDKIRIDFKLEDIDKIIIEEDWQKEECIELLENKFGKNDRINFDMFETNYSRRILDEG